MLRYVIGGWRHRIGGCRPGIAKGSDGGETGKSLANRDVQSDRWGRCRWGTNPGVWREIRRSADYRMKKSFTTPYVGVIRSSRVVGGRRLPVPGRSRHLQDNRSRLSTVAGLMGWSSAKMRGHPSLWMVPLSRDQPGSTSASALLLPPYQPKKINPCHISSHYNNGPEHDRTLPL